MAAATLSNFIFSPSPSLSLPSSLPKFPPTHLSLTLPSRPTTRGCFIAAAVDQNQAFSVANSALDSAASDIYNVEVIVEEDEPEERLLNRFRREVMRAGIIQETRRRRFFENKQEEKKRRTRDAAKRNRRRRQNSRFTPQNKVEEAPVSKKKEDDDIDNWDLPAGDVPYLN